MNLRGRIIGVSLTVLLFGYYALANFASEEARLDSALIPDESLRLGLDLRGGLLRVVGKGGHERVVPLGELAVSAIEAYLEQARPLLLGSRADRSHALFLTRRGGATTRQNYFTLLRKLAGRAGIARDRVSPLVMRHAFATDLLEGGADLRSIR